MDAWATLIDELERSGVTLSSWLLAWARVLPSVVLIPAFGARFLPPAGRAVLGLSLAVVVTPAMQVESSTTPFVVAFLFEILRGVPVAVSGSVLIWASMMAGGLIDDLRGASQASSNLFADASTPLASLLGLFGAVAFFETGGAFRLVQLLSDPEALAERTWLRVVSDLVGSVELALAFAAPMLAATIVWEVAGALVARAAAPAHIQALLAPLRSLAILAVLAVSTEAIFDLLSRLMARAL